MPARNACAVSRWASLSVPACRASTRASSWPLLGGKVAFSPPSKRLSISAIACELDARFVVVSGDRAVVQAGIAQRCVDELVAQDGLHCQHRRPSVEQQWFRYVHVALAQSKGKGQPDVQGSTCYTENVGLEPSME
jgi:hypothetical protein